MRCPAPESRKKHVPVGRRRTSTCTPAATRTGKPPSPQRLTRRSAAPPKSPGSHALSTPPSAAGSRPTTARLPNSPSGTTGDHRPARNDLALNFLNFLTRTMIISVPSTATLREQVDAAERPGTAPRPATRAA